MFRMMKALVAATALAAVLSPAAALADDQPRDVTCSVNVTYQINSNTPVVYAKDFEVPAGGRFFDDFGNSFRFRDFTATTSVDEKGRMVVRMDYYNDVTVFDTVNTIASLTMYDENGTTITGQNTVWSRAGYKVDYTLSCAKK